MKNYRLDPNNPPRLTPEQERRLDETPIDYSDIPPLDQIDWRRCPDVESVPDRCGGQWVVKDRRVLAQGILDNAEAGCSAEEIAREIYDLDLDVVRRILAFARST